MTTSQRTKTIADFFAELDIEPSKGWALLQNWGGDNLTSDHVLSPADESLLRSILTEQEG